MQQLSLSRLIGKRLADDWKLLLSVFIGIIFATTLAAGTPVYLTSLGQLSFYTSLDRIPAPVLNINVSTPNIPLSQRSIEMAEQSLAQAIDRHIAPIYLGQEKYLKGAVSVVGLPNQPLPEGGGAGVIVSRGYFQHLTDLEGHSRFVEGRMASSLISVGDRGPDVEAVISAQTASEFDLSPGDVVIFSTVLEAENVISVQIVGTVAPADASMELWAAEDQILDPAPLKAPTPLLVQADPDEPPLALFVTQDVMSEFGGDLGTIVTFGEDTYFRGANYLAGHQRRPLPVGGGSGVLVPLGFLQHLSNLEQHVRFTDGRMGGSGVSMGPNGPKLEAAVSLDTARRYGLSVGDVVTVSPTLGTKPVLSAEIVGIMEPENTSEVYWTSALIFFDPSSVTQNIPLLVQLVPDVSPVSLFVTQETMVKAIGRTYPGSLVNPIWFVLVDKERLKNWSVDEARRRLMDFEKEVVRTIQGSSASTGLVSGLTDVGEKRSLFSKTPLLLILAVMVATVLVFLSMMVSYLVRTRESDAAMLRTRGVGTLQLLRIYAVEGLAMTAVAAVLAPFLSMAIIALAGLLPPFREMTGGRLMPVMLEPMPLLVAFGVGLLCLGIFALPGVMSARGGVLLQRLRTSRPPALPFFHRYYADVGLLVLGGLAFWELNQRGHLVSGGLFKDVDVNETLLLAPILFLIVVALVLVRMFPLVMRFISGESHALVHLLVTLTTPALAAAIVYRVTQDGGGGAWLGTLALVAATASVYWLTNRLRRLTLRLLGLLIQTGLIAGFLAAEPLDPDQLIFVPTVGLISIVPAQFVFLLLRAVARVSPVWLLIGLRRMARNPLQYTWLMLLLVMVTGLGILATTVGGTLERSQRERIQYDIPSDMRLSYSSRELGGPVKVREQLVGMPGVTSVSMAYRGKGTVGNSNPEVLAVESSDFADISWYRDDFSDRPLSDVMSELQPSTAVDRIAIPRGADTISVWIKPLEFNPFLTAVFQVERSSGTLETIILGNPGLPEWTLMTGAIPANYERPLYLVSFLIFQPFGVESPGTLLMDDIHVTLGASGEEQVLEDFEGEMRWLPVVTASLSSEGMSAVAGAGYRGGRAGSFSFGVTSFQGFQGIYHSPTVGPLPIVVSSSITDGTDLDVGASFLGRVDRRWIPMVIKGTVDHFPTLDPDEGGFVLAELDLLMNHVNVLYDFFASKPNEAFIGHTPDSHDAVREAIAELIGRTGQIRDRADQLDALSTDPYVTAGWKPMVLLALVVGVLAASVGYVTYLLLFAKRTGSELGSLRSIGLSRLQQLGLLGFEHLAIAAIGLGVGTWAGFLVSRMMVSPLAVTETGEPVVPPTMLTIDWSLMTPTFAAIVGVFLVALFMLDRAVRRLDLHTIARVGEA